MRNIGKIQGIFENSLQIEEMKSSVHFSHIEPTQFETFKRKWRLPLNLQKAKTLSIKFAFKTSW